MTTEGTYVTRTIQANAELGADNLFKAITIGGTVAATPLQAAGILRSRASPGQGATTIFQGDAKVRVGAAVNTLGFPLTVAASGWLTPMVTSGGMTIGRALSLAASGDTIQAFVNFSSAAGAAVS